MRLLRYTIIRLMQAIPSLFALTVLSFLLIRLAPGDPARVVAGLRASKAAVAHVREQLGLDQPVLVQYGRFVGRAVSGQFGDTIKGTGSVSKIIGTGLLVTGGLTLLSLVLVVIVSVALALFAAGRSGTALDSGIRLGAIGGIAIPAFWVGLLLLTFVAVPTGWFPIGGWGTDFSTQFQALLLPAITMTISFSPLLVRSLRSAAITVLQSDYVGAARRAGVPRRRLWSRYVLRNSAAQSIPVLALVAAGVFGGSAVVESIFNLPGLGAALVQASTQRDANLLQADTLVIGVSVILIFLLADVAVAAVDRRVKL